jgi:hypothetical protein
MIQAVFQGRLPPKSVDEYHDMSHMEARMKTTLGSSSAPAEPASDESESLANSRKTFTMIEDSESAQALAAQQALSETSRNSEGVANPETSRPGSSTTAKPPKLDIIAGIVLILFFGPWPGLILAGNISLALQSIASGNRWTRGVGLAFLCLVFVAVVPCLTFACVLAKAPKTETGIPTLPEHVPLVCGLICFVTAVVLCGDLNLGSLTGRMAGIPGGDMDASGYWAYVVSSMLPFLVLLIEF